VTGSCAELRIGLTISGAIALGAYEGGALAALLCAVQAVNEETRGTGRQGAIRVDAMAGASAGSITALIAARTLLCGLDPIEAMYGAWVTTPQLDQLTDGSLSPLSVESTKKEALRILDGEGHLERAQSEPIRVHMSLGCLRGLDYSIKRISGSPISANTYLDWGEWTITPSRKLEWYVAEGGPLDSALASGAHAAAFPPMGLDRSDPEIQRGYRKNNIEYFPRSKFLWYTDGGTIDNEPLGRALDLSESIDSDEDPIPDRAGRLHLLITPDPARPSHEDGPWATPHPEPSWLKTGLRTAKLMRSQRLYDDLRRVEKTNSRIEWVRQLEQVLLECIRDPTRAEGRLSEAADSIRGQRRTLASPEDQRNHNLPAEPEPGLAEALRDALDAATGFAKKRDVSVAVVSPMLIPEVAAGEAAPHDVLTGEFLGHFGGFLDQRYRHCDFELGYRCMSIWLQEQARSGQVWLDARLAEAAAKGAESEWGSWPEPPAPIPDDVAHMNLKRVPRSAKFKLLAVGLRSLGNAMRQVRGLHE
jgi:hypothetical protein